MSGESALPGAYARIIAAVGAQDVEALEELLDAEVADHDPVPERPPGREDTVMWMCGMHAAGRTGRSMTTTVPPTAPVRPPTPRGR